jgi:hypothetical protein
MQINVALRMLFFGGGYFASSSASNFESTFRSASVRSGPKKEAANWAA